MIVPYRQKLPDTCLPSCLLMVLQNKGVIKKANFDLEAEILIEGGKIGRLNRTFGHLTYVSRRFELKAEYITDSILAYNEALRLLSLEKIKPLLSCQKNKINLPLVIEFIKDGPVILGVDNYVFNRDFHFPHFILVEKKVQNNYQIIEPWQGERLMVAESNLEEAIKSLETKIGYWKEMVHLF